MALLPTDAVDRTHPGSSDLDQPSLPPSINPPFVPASLCSSIFVVIQSVNYGQEKPTSDYGGGREGGRDGLVTSSGVKEGRANPRGASEAIASSLPLPPFLPFLACSLLRTVSCTVRGRRPKRYAQRSASPRVREEGGAAEGSDGVSALF